MIGRGLCAALAMVATSAAAQSVPPLPARPVVSEIVAPDAARVRQFTGVVVAAKSLTLAFQTLGRIADRPVSVGDQVKAGDVLARLDQVTLDEDVTNATGALASASAQMTTADNALERAHELAARRVDTAAREEEAARARAAAAAVMESAAADLARARDALGFAELRAPIDGIVTRTMIDAGAVVSAGTPVLTLAGDDGREAVIDLTDGVLSVLRLGDRFAVSLRAGDPPVDGRLTEVEPVADAATRTRAAHITLVNPPAAYRIGALVRVRAVGRAGSLVTLPVSAILTRSGETWAWRVAPGTRAATRIPITVGPVAYDDRAIITDGLTPGDEIIVKGVNSLQDGQIVGPGAN
jgi:RND family efflux transporter MFP subunit